MLRSPTAKGYCPARGVWKQPELLELVREIMQKVRDGLAGRGLTRECGAWNSFVPLPQANQCRSNRLFGCRLHGLITTPGSPPSLILAEGQTTSQKWDRTPSEGLVFELSTNSWTELCR